MRIVKSSMTVALTSLLVACSPGSQSADDTIPTQPPFLVTATVQDLMESDIDPAADFIWGSVGTVITAAGVDDRQPRTDEQWDDVRRQAITLVEATNLLIMPGRHVAVSEFPSTAPGVLSSAQIEHKLDADRAQFDAFVLELRQVALKELDAIAHRDAAALTRAGEAMDDVCEACHVANWYPHQVIPALPDFRPAS
jgi:hypothetical protein